ncbi:MAG: 4Fe-4S binding protein, partial [Planctomycetes bacterium]|nr:4Fe-4S binding protein [Planctomycetota bacterium]
MSEVASAPPVVALPRDDKFRPRGTVKWSRIGAWRAAALIAVHLAVIAHVAHWKIAGETVSPLEPSEAMQTLELGYVNAGFLVLVVSILTTAVLGRFFCGWVCHFVAYQDLCGWILRKLGLKPKPVRSRLLVFVPFIAAFYMFLWPTLWRWWEGAPGPELEWRPTTERFWETFPGWGMAIVTILLAGFLIVHWLGAKGFCTYGCPYGALFGLADRLSPLRVKVTDACETCGHCTTVCSSNVRVHEEVARYRMVVDPGCMKTLDCVNSCPKQALHLGWAFRPLRAATRKWRSPGADFSWVEEIAMFAVGWIGFFAFRGLYRLVPFLLAVTLGVFFAIAVVTTWRLLRRRDVRFQHHLLRTDGRLTRAGWSSIVLIGAFLALTAHSGVVRYVTWSGTSAAERAMQAQDPAEGESYFTEAERLLVRAESLGLATDPEVMYTLALIAFRRGRAADAEARLLRTTEILPSFEIAYSPLAEL